MAGFSKGKREHKVKKERGMIVMSLFSQFECKGDVLIVRLSGELDHHETERVKVMWQHHLNAKSVKHVIVNLEKLSFMDSSGLGVMLGRYKEIKYKGGQMVICSISPQVKRLFDLSGLHKIVDFERDETAALSRLGVAS